MQFSGSTTKFDIFLALTLFPTVPHRKNLDRFKTMCQSMSGIQIDSQGLLGYTHGPCRPLGTHSRAQKYNLVPVDP